MKIETPLPLLQTREESLRLLSRVLIFVVSPLTLMVLVAKLTGEMPDGKLPILLETGLPLPFGLLMGALIRPSASRSLWLRGTLAISGTSALAAWGLLWNGPRPPNVIALAISLSLTVLFFERRTALGLVLGIHLVAGVVGNALRRAGVISLADEMSPLSVLSDVGSTLLTIVGLGVCANLLWVTLENYRKGQLELAERARQLMEAQAEAQRLQQQHLVATLATALATDVADIVQVLGDGTALLAPKITDAHSEQVLAHMRATTTRASYLLRLLSSLETTRSLLPQHSNVQHVLAQLGQELPALLGERVSWDVLNTASGRPMVQAEQLEQVLMHLSLMVRDSMPGGGIITVRAYDGLGDVTRSDGRRNWTIIEVGKVATSVVSPDADAPNGAVAAQDAEVSDLGLALVRHVVSDAGGRLEVERRGSVGTHFLLQLPTLAA